MTNPYAPQPGYGAQPQNTQGLVSMILGIVAIPMLCCFYTGIPIGIAAAVLGWMGKQKADQGLATNRPQAMAGFILGIVAAALGILLILLVVVFSVVDVPGVN